MRRIKFLIRNMYRVMVVKPNGNRAVISFTESIDQTEKELLPDSTLRQFVMADELSFKADPKIRILMEQKVRDKGRRTGTVKNSLFEIFLPVFSLKQFELKMALISLALIITLGIGPSGNQAPNRNRSFFFLADTLSDTSVYYLPAARDSVFRMQCK